MPNIYMMDLWCQVPFYNAYLSQALRAEGVDSILGSTRFHLEPDYFVRRSVKTDPRLCSVVSRLNINSAKLRRSLKFLEFSGNLASLALRFSLAKPDVIHVQWVPLVDQGLPIEMWFLKFAKKRGIKLAYTVHNVLPHDVELSLKEAFAEVYRQMDVLICHTEEARERLINEFGLKQEKIRVIPHGPLFYDCKLTGGEEAKRRLGFAAGHCVVLCQGNVRPYKGIEFLLDAWKKIQASQPNARLVICGTGEKQYLELIRAKVERLELQASVRLELRYLRSEELPLYYQAADIAVCAHREITQSGSLMTAIAFGKPIIATDVPAFREALEPSASGVFVNYGDAESLSHILNRLIQNPEERKSLADNSSSQDLHQFWRRIARQTQSCYQELLRRPEHPIRAQFRMSRGEENMKTANPRESHES